MGNRVVGFKGPSQAGSVVVGDSRLVGCDEGVSHTGGGAGGEVDPMSLLEIMAREISGGKGVHRGCVRRGRCRPVGHAGRSLWERAKGHGRDRALRGIARRLISYVQREKTPTYRIKGKEKEEGKQKKAEPKHRTTWWLVHQPHRAWCTVQPCGPCPRTCHDTAHLGGPNSPNPTHSG